MVRLKYELNWIVPTNKILADIAQNIKKKINLFSLDLLNYQ